MLIQRTHAAEGYQKRLAMRGAPWLRPGTSVLKLTLRVDAEVGAEPLRFTFKEKKRKKFHLVGVD